MRSEAAILAQPAVPAPRYRIRDGVAKVVRRNAIVLVSPVDGTSMRISPVAAELMPLLAEGALFEELAAQLRELHPTAIDVKPKLTAFLNQLKGAGLLDLRHETRTRRWRTPRLELFDADPAAAAIARAIGALPPWLLWGLLAVLLLGALVGIAGVVGFGRLPHPSALVTQFSGWGLAIFMLLVVPLHETAHAVACRLAGSPVGKAGLVVHSWTVPGPYVETTQAYRLRGRARRFWIPAAGPAVNWIATGAAAWGLLLGSPASADLFGTLFLLGALFVYLDTNPLTPSDGSHMLEALLNDELARSAALSSRRARLSGWKTVVIYRIAASLHAQGSLVLLYLWWTLA